MATTAKEDQGQLVGGGERDDVCNMVQKHDRYYKCRTVYLCFSTTLTTRQHVNGLLNGGCGGWCGGTLWCL